jgi:hypothetical protein
MCFAWLMLSRLGLLTLLRLLLLSHTVFPTCFTMPLRHVFGIGMGGGDVSMAQVGIGVRMMTARQINIDFVLE